MATSGSTPVGGTAGERPTVFLRKASGVVKAFAPFDSFAYNSIANNILAVGAISLLLIPFAYPGGNVPLGMLLTGVLVGLGGVVYSMLQATMPRSGGDYVFQSRILGGSVGFILAFTTYVIIGGMWLGLYGWQASNITVGPFLTLFGVYWQWQPLRDFAAWLISPAGIFVGGFVGIAWAVIMVSVGFSTYAKVQRWFFWIGLAATVVMFAYIALYSQQGFVGNFDSFMAQNFQVTNAYQTTIDTARVGGASANFDFSLGDTIAIVPAGLFILLWALWGAGNAGEIRDKGTFRAKMWQIVGSLALTTGLAMLAGYLMITRFGGEFLSSAGWIYYNAPDQSVLPVAPYLGFFAAALSANPILTFIVFLAFSAWWFMALPTTLVYASRVSLSMSMDRALPAWLGKVNSRTHTPLNAVLTLGLVGLVFDVLYAFTDWFWKLTLSGGLMTLISSSVVCFGAAIWPFIRREQFKASPIAKYVVAGVPVVTICGILFDIGALYCFWQFVTVPALGIASTEGYLFNIGALVLGAILYFTFKAYRKSRESLDLALVYREIPPE